ncbi:MAG TPA: 16S rRNA (guanine(527)-N(7))-methyltransferase RsmG [Candidatus Limnocylindrales bacterium]|nr:16S rRNA (guanine(527)-N(7))-methyltransferase RsmG [Candidatus Limnocylindrales bacterium]
MEDRTARGAHQDDAGSGTNRRTRARPHHGHADRWRAPLPTRVTGLPALPADYLAALDDGLRELRVDLSEHARRAIADHVRLLLAWTSAINLTAIREPSAIARLHVLDSLTAVEPLRAAGATSILDLGSGGGFPGLPLAVALPESRVLLVDSIAKKVRFLEAAIGVTGTSGRVAARATRAEVLAHDPTHRERWDAVTARAVGPLDELVELALPLLRIGGRLVAWKRADPAADPGAEPPGRSPATRTLAAEIAAAQAVLPPLGGGRVDVHDPGLRFLPGHVLVVVSKVSPADSRYPRTPRDRSKSITRSGE